jgi:hypothetical protein
MMMVIIIIIITIITITVSDYIFIGTTYHLITEQWFMNSVFAFCSEYMMSFTASHSGEKTDV